MTPIRCLSLTVLLVAAPNIWALEALDDQHLSDISGQGQGLRITQQFENTIDSISYIDDDGLNGSAGTLTLSNVRVYTPDNRPTIMDIEVKDIDGKKALVITSRQDFQETEIGAVSVNGNTLISMGTSGTQILDEAKYVNPETRIYTGGHSGNGLTIDTISPTYRTQESWQEDDGTRVIHTTTSLEFHKAPNARATSVVFKNITIDIVDEGLRIGIPEVSGATSSSINTRVGNERVGYTYHGSSSIRNMNIPTGGYLLLKNAKEAGKQGLELDLSLPSGTNMENVTIQGFVDLDTYYQGQSENFEQSAKITLKSDLLVKGMRVNVDGERGVVMDFDPTGPANVASVNLEMKDITLKHNSVASPKVVSLGTLDVQLNLTNQTYIQIEGH
ncbi:MAG: DUF6160 family protein [Venatoribacter sp.]